MAQLVSNLKVTQRSNGHQIFWFSEAWLGSLSKYEPYTYSQDIGFEFYLLS